MKAGRPSTPSRFSLPVVALFGYRRGSTKLSSLPPRRRQRLCTTRLTRRIQRLDSRTVALLVRMIVTLGHRHRLVAGEVVNGLKALRQYGFGVVPPSAWMRRGLFFGRCDRRHIVGRRAVVDCNIRQLIFARRS